MTPPAAMGLARPMRYWEVWNEPNINGFNGAGARASAAAFARLLRITRGALRSANRGNRVVLGGLYRKPKPGTGIRMTRFLRRLYKLKRGRSSFDAVAIHPYAARPRQILGVTRTARRVMNAHGDRRKPLWITELGWTTGGAYWGQSLYRATLAQQATRLARTARLLLANRRRLVLRRVVWHTWRDGDSGDNGFWDRHMGLFTVDGHPKPAWAGLHASHRRLRGRSDPQRRALPASERPVTLQAFSAEALIYGPSRTPFVN